MRISIVGELDGEWWTYRHAETVNWPPPMAKIQSEHRPRNYLPSNFQTTADARTHGDLMAISDGGVTGVRPIPTAFPTLEMHRIPSADGVKSPTATTHAVQHTERGVFMPTQANFTDYAQGARVDPARCAWNSALLDARLQSTNAPTPPPEVLTGCSDLASFSHATTPLSRESSSADNGSSRSASVSMLASGRSVTPGQSRRVERRRLHAGCRRRGWGPPPGPLKPVKAMAKSMAR
ncbi:hypothetical protein LTR66_010079 [Elasticomyces elasticus]|nr:hypothetical protein LTR66_010079 [Elasticomyces elasticus]